MDSTETSLKENVTLVTKPVLLVQEELTIDVLTVQPIDTTIKEDVSYHAQISSTLTLTQESAHLVKLHVTIVMDQTHIPVKIV